jgi:hypothetical protein
MLIVLSKSDLLDVPLETSPLNIQTQYPLLPVTLASVMEDDGLRASPITFWRACVT